MPSYGIVILNGTLAWVNLCSVATHLLFCFVQYLPTYCAVLLLLYV